ncbi:hypothetical protein B0H14DRAFT_2645946 [Mycena olivaceomarginata]|nr:hypothetical protein B0H14DRAFT_2645946 [Mycena olivaceomarginata]
MAKSGQLARCGKNPKRAAFSLAGSLLASALNSNCKYIQGDIRGTYKVDRIIDIAMRQVFVHCHTVVDVHQWPQVTSPRKMGERYGIEACGNDKVAVSYNSRRRAKNKIGKIMNTPLRKGNHRSRGLFEGPCGRWSWSKNDTSQLLDLVEKHLPLGQKGWKLVIAAFCEWADASGRPARDGKAIEGKYKMLLKTKKPTGDAHCPPEIKRAQDRKPDQRES